MTQRGWDECDCIIVTPDAYVDHPSFAMALLGRFLEHHGYRVGILTQPRWREPSSFLALGEPRLGFVVSGGNVDSMVLNYTPALKPRREDRYCEGANPFFSTPGEGKKYRIRPDRAVSVYANQIRNACRGVPIIIGGIEASLRRIAHYDYWSNSVRRSVLFDAKADILIYGMGEYPLLRVLKSLEEGLPWECMEIENTAVARKEIGELENPILLPSYTEVKEDKTAFARAFCDFAKNRDTRVLAQLQDTRYLVQYPRKTLSQKELDAIYEVPFERRPHPRFRSVPAFEMIRDSVTSHRGCYGNCSFCAIGIHQGAEIVSRSADSIVREVQRIARDRSFRGTITDVGGPSANMFGSFCRAGGCDDPDCLGRGHACPNLVPGIREYLELLNTISLIPGVRHVFVGSGLRYDPVLMPSPFLRELLRRHISGQMKVAPESGCDRVLELMHKPDVRTFAEFKRKFDSVTSEEKIRNYLIPYMIVGHPGEGEKEFADTVNFMKDHGLKGSQFQIFTPSPLTLSTAMYYCGFDPCTGRSVTVEKRKEELEKRKKALINGKY
jgi:uncharacterized radical SAM protein YgiQ